MKLARKNFAENAFPLQWGIVLRVLTSMEWITRGLLYAMVYDILNMFSSLLVRKKVRILDANNAAHTKLTPRKCMGSMRLS